MQNKREAAGSPSSPVRRPATRASRVSVASFRDDALEEVAEQELLE